nr:MAG TPA: hypothetical protein [Caudoviricetes sp.]
MFSFSIDTSLNFLFANSLIFITTSSFNVVGS